MASTLDLILEREGEPLLERLGEKYGKAVLINKPEEYDKNELISKIAYDIGEGLGINNIKLIEFRLVPETGAEIRDIEDGELFTFEGLIQRAKKLEPELKNMERLNSQPIAYQQITRCFHNDKLEPQPEMEDTNIIEFGEVYYSQIKGPTLRIVREKRGLQFTRNKKQLEELLKYDISEGRIKSVDDYIEQKIRQFQRSNVEDYGCKPLTGKEAEYEFWIKMCSIMVPILAKDERGTEYVLGVIHLSDFDYWDLNPISEKSMKILEKIANTIQPVLSNAYLAHKWKVINEKLKRTNNELETALKELKEAQEIIVRTKAQAEYAKFSEQVNHQINTLMLGVLPGIEHLIEANGAYSRNVARLFSRGIAKEEMNDYFSLEEEIAKHAETSRNLTGIEWIRAKQKAREVLSKRGITIDSLIEKYAKMQLPEATSEKLLSLIERHGVEVIESAYSLFDIRHSLSTMKISAKRIADLVGAIRDYTYGGKAENYDIRTGINSTVLIMEVKLGGVVIDKRYEDKQIPKITCYPGALDQVWTNIINNAIEAGAKNIIIDAYSLNENELAVRIENDGPQIPPSDIDKIFDKYYSTKNKKEEGRGIGLYMCREIVEKQHGGRISVYSDPQRTYFEVI
ncbi:MAG: HAMP domain-containing sensor histidine kinase, partial [Candidatus Woesearchaeota archaeon]